ncbi:hypothetical protein CDL15_Pgr009184 [Punica granatum]|uniref:Uncharacterized protein n=1 Tax=Punica granatum TaxID=22663 RepID=A0A218WVT5_PUNGR|nr:hypothetical protein CDL15_Pgr009184 [Punica granatum]
MGSRFLSEIRISRPEPETKFGVQSPKLNREGLNRRKNRKLKSEGENPSRRSSSIFLVLVSVDLPIDLPSILFDLRFSSIFDSAKYLTSSIVFIAASSDQRTTVNKVRLKNLTEDWVVAEVMVEFISWS